MFRLPKVYTVEMSFEDATKTLQRLTSNGGLLEGLQYMDARWNEYQETYGTDECEFEYDDDFYYNWQYELSAFNIVYKKMAPLFATK